MATKEFAARDRKKKGILRYDDEKYQLMQLVKKKKEEKYRLTVWINGEEGINDTDRNVSVYMYTVVLWINPNQQLSTEVSSDEPYRGDPEFRFVLDKFSMEYCEFLYMEVIRHQKAGSSGAEPGTSSGRSLVGACKIRLPKVRTRKEGCFELSKYDGHRITVHGHIEVALGMTRIRQDYY